MPAEFLFDTQKEPWETRNLHKGPRFRQVLMRMQSRMKEEILTQKDIMLLPEAELETISEHSNPYEFRLNEELFHVREIYEEASLSGFRIGRASCRGRVCQ